MQCPSAGAALVVVRDASERSYRRLWAQMRALAGQADRGRARATARKGGNEDKEDDEDDEVFGGLCGVGTRLVPVEVRPL